MAQAKLNVVLFDLSENAMSIIYAACRQCYSSKFAAQIFKDGKDNTQSQEDFIRQIVASGHESPLEHVKFTFAIEGVSRVLTHQLVGHRVASYSQQSQRYVKESDFDYVIPPSVEEDEELKRVYIETMKKIQKAYSSLMNRLAKKGRKGETVNQDARFVLPQAAETKIVVTMNCRELLHFSANGVAPGRSGKSERLPKKCSSYVSGGYPLSLIVREQSVSGWVIVRRARNSRAKDTR